MEINLNDIPRDAQPKRKKQNTGAGKSFNLNFSTGKKLSDKKKFWFYNELSLLLSSGVDLKTTFELIASEERGKSLELLNEIKDEIVEGNSLSGAMAKRKSFGAYDRYTIKIGEESGKLAHVLKLLAVYYEKKLRLRRQIISALTYPTLVVLAAVGAIGFLINYLVPMFEDVFKRFSGQLPTITQNVIDLSKWLTANGMIILLILAGIILLLRTTRNHWIMRKMGSFMALNTPVFGRILHKNNLARFCQSMSLLLSSSVPLSHSLDLLTHMIRF